MSHDPKDLAQLYRILSGYEVALLTTISPEGYLHTRPMSPTPQVAGVDLWFISHESTHKIEDLLAHPEVGISYYRPSDRAYASLSGLAIPHRDPERIYQAWRHEWRAWFPRGPQDSGLVCIDVEVLHVEYTEMRAESLRVLWSLLKQRARRASPYLGELRSFDLPPGR